MNVANALAAAAAAWAAGAHLHDIRQGLRTFSTSFFQAPGRLNLLEVGGVRVVIDYCHNVDGMRQLADFVNRMMVEPPTQAGARRARARPARRPGPAARSASSGSPATGATRTSASTARSPRRAFDEIIIREDKNLRGRQPGETATNVVEGVRAARAEGTRPRRSRVEKILEEMAAVRAALRRAHAGRPRGHVRRRRRRRLPRGDGVAGRPSTAGPRSRTRASSRRPRARAGEPARRYWPALVREAGRELGDAVGGGVDLARAEPAEEREDGLALLVADQDHDPRRIGTPAARAGRAQPVELGLERDGLGLVDRRPSPGPCRPRRHRRGSRRRPLSRVRPRRYVSVSLIATRCARSAAIRPMPRSVSSGRSPAVPMIAVIGAARPAAPPAIPSATSRIAPRSRPRCGRSRR